MKVRYTLCYLGSIMIFIAYCVGKVDNMLPTLPPNALRRECNGKCIE